MKKPQVVNFARQAFQEGKTAREFDETAQRYAMAFWLCAFAGVASWYMNDWGWALLAVTWSGWF